MLTWAMGTGEVQAAACPQTQYHGGFQAESALGGKLEAGDLAPVSRARGEAVSPQNEFSMRSSTPTQKCRSIGSYIASESQANSAGYLPVEMQFNSQAVQYQPRRVRYQPSGAAAIEAVATKVTRSDTGLMIRIGLVLAAAYVVFLMFWFWATRVRPRPRRARSGIDTRRRME
jgi:Tfp pilus assembly protein FimT